MPGMTAFAPIPTSALHGKPGPFILPRQCSDYGCAVPLPYWGHAMELGQRNWRKGLVRLWLVAAVLWAAVATTLFPLGMATSAIRHNALTTQQQLALFEAADRSYSFCLQQPPLAIESVPPGLTPEQIQLMQCNVGKQFNIERASGMPRNVAWGHVGAFAAAWIVGALGIASVIVVAAWVAGGFKRA
jgi:hypothetical protein